MSASDSTLQQQARIKQIEELDSICVQVANIVKASSTLKKSDLSFYKTTHPEYGQRVDTVAHQILDYVNKLVRDVYSEEEDKDVPQMEDMEDVVDNFSKMVDVVDDVLEKSNNYLDILMGRKKGVMVDRLQPSQPVVVTSTSKDAKQRSYITAKNIRRPQLEFEDKVDNTNTPFVRKMNYKPNAKRPLNYGLPGSDEITSDMAQHVKSLGITSANASLVSLPHPYEYEIQTIDYPSHVLEERTEILFKSFEETPFTFVDTPEALKEMLSIISSSQELAVDLEHHDYRSFQGFTCLIQISTRNEDFIVDALKLRSHLHALNDTFTDPNIVKIFHGADMDVKWLQKDFGVYIVNLFDTYHASHALELGQHGLAHLLDFYCSVKTDKKYQLADWRIRPIPEEMMNYARSDTHYLLFIYDRMRNELIARSNPETLNLLRTTLSNSCLVALKKYEKDIYDAETGEGPGGWKNALFKYGGAYNADQVAVFKTIHQWRDVVARREDESTRYILPNHMLYAIVENLPTDANGIFRCCKHIPPYIKMYGVELARLIVQTLKDARAHSQARAAELARLKEEQAAKQAEWEAKKKQGPVHIRFEESTEKKDPKAVKSVQQEPKDIPMDERPPVRDIKHAIELDVKESCSLLLSSLPVNSDIMDKVQEIKKNLVLIPPVLAQQPVVQIRQVSPPTTVPNPIVCQEEQPQEKATVFVLSDMKKQEKVKRKSDVIQEQQDSDSHSNPTPKKKKSNQTPSDPVTITPFDYSTASSTVDKGKKSAPVDIFNPYDTKDDSKPKKKKLSVKPKSVKSMSFMKPK